MDTLKYKSCNVRLIRMSDSDLTFHITPGFEPSGATITLSYRGSNKSNFSTVPLLKDCEIRSSFGLDLFMKALQNILDDRDKFDHLLNGWSSQVELC